jgi:hypothetical protein
LGVGAATGAGRAGDGAHRPLRRPGYGAGDRLGATNAPRLGVADSGYLVGDVRAANDSLERTRSTPDRLGRAGRGNRVSDTDNAQNGGLLDGNDGIPAAEPPDMDGDDSLDETVGQGPPDVLLDVHNLSVDEITLEVEDLEAHVSLQVEVLELLKLNVGADVTLGRVSLKITGVKAKVLLKVRLDRVAQIIDRVLTTIDNNPQIVEQVVGAVEPVGTAVGEIGAGAGRTAEEVGQGAADAVEPVDDAADEALEIDEDPQPARRS